jgi:formate dehydrogenase iron-sulfur subunit
MKWGLLFDSTRCIGCGACSAACKEQNGLPPTIEAKPTAYTWTVVEKRSGVNMRHLCMHCLNPTCVSVCPVGAMKKTETGPVVYDSDLCIGCRYCIMACPFGVPKYQWDRPVPIVGKCVMCAPRIAAGQPTACATVCPTGATMFGERDALIREARQRIASEPSRYVDHVYGLTEAGGTSVLLLAGVPFDQLGMRGDLPPEALPLLTWRVLSHLPDLVVLAATALYGVHWITKRRELVKLTEGDAPVEPPTPPDGGHGGHTGPGGMAP